MGAFQDPNASYTIATQRVTGDDVDLAPLAGDTKISTPIQVLHNECIGKDYEDRYVKLHGLIEDLNEGETLTLKILVNGQTKSERNYSANGFTCDPENKVSGPQANVNAGDIVQIEASTTQATAVELRVASLFTIAGKIETEQC